MQLIGLPTVEHAMLDDEIRKNSKKNNESWLITALAEIKKKN